MKTCSRCKQEKPLADFSATEYRCRDCMRDKARAYREAHPDRVKASQAKYNQTDKAKAKARRFYENGGKEKQQAWVEANRDKTRAASKRHYESHRETENARSLKWRAEHPDEVRRHRRESHYRNYETDIARGALRRARESEFSVSDKDVRRIMSQPCAECGTTDNLHLDHIVPLARGGRHTVGNLQMLCQHCNQSKGKKVMTEWRAWLAKTA